MRKRVTAELYDGVWRCTFQGDGEKSPVNPIDFRSLLRSLEVGYREYLQTETRRLKGDVLPTKPSALVSMLNGVKSYA